MVFSMMIPANVFASDDEKIFESLVLSMLKEDASVDLEDNGGVIRTHDFYDIIYKHYEKKELDEIKALLNYNGLYLTKTTYKPVIDKGVRSSVLSSADVCKFYYKIVHAKIRPEATAELAYNIKSRVVYDNRTYDIRSATYPTLEIILMSGSGKANNWSGSRTINNSAGTVSYSFSFVPCSSMMLNYVVANYEFDNQASSFVITPWHDDTST